MLTIYTKNTCPYCVKAKNYLRLKNIAFTEVNIEDHTDSAAFLKQEGHRSVPQIYQNGKLFVQGGCDGLMRLSDEDLIMRLSENS
jgi:glutaredoxin